jgi:hypothetical protein
MWFSDVFHVNVVVTGSWLLGTCTRYVRLELLEGVAAYHSGDLPGAWATLRAALRKLEQLQVPDEGLAELLTMGFTPSEVGALRACIARREEGFCTALSVLSNNLIQAAVWLFLLMHFKGIQ